MGLYFDELDEGRTFESPSRSITAGDVEAFIALTGDDNRLHTDDDFARENGFDRRIAHGALVVALATGLAWQTGMLVDTTIAFRSIDAWKFILPVYPDDSISLRVVAGECRPLPRLKAGLVRFDLDVVNQHGAVVASGALRMLMRNRPA